MENDQLTCHVGILKDKMKDCVKQMKTNKGKLALYRGLIEILGNKKFQPLTVTGRYYKNFFFDSVIFFYLFFLIKVNEITIYGPLPV